MVDDVAAKLAQVHQLFVEYRDELYEHLELEEGSCLPLYLNMTSGQHARAGF